MSYSLQKATLKKVCFLSLAMMLVGCSSDHLYKFHLSSDEAYLDSVPLKVLKMPVGITPPVQSEKFKVPVVTLKGSVGKQLDIRPPMQYLVPLNSSQA